MDIEESDLPFPDFNPNDPYDVWFAEHERVFHLEEQAGIGNVMADVYFDHPDASPEEKKFEFRKKYFSVSDIGVRKELIEAWMRYEEADDQWLRVQIDGWRYYVDRLDQGLVKPHSLQKNDPRVELRYLEEDMEEKRELRPTFSSNESVTGKPD
jgi:hypothetical protein